MKKSLYFTISILSMLYFLTSCKEPPSDSIYLERPLGIEILEDGNFLVTDGGGLYTWSEEGSKVLILSESGEILWFYDKDLAFAHSATQLSNKNILIPDTNNDRLLEVNWNKEVVWSTDRINGGLLSDGSRLSYPNYVDELTEGTFLVSDRLNNRVLVLNRLNEVLWTYTGSKKQHAPVVLENGNYLIADSHSNRIIEIDPVSKDIVWDYSDDLSWPRFAQRLVNGETIITDSGHNRFFKIDSEKNIVFDFNKNISAPYQVIFQKDSYLVCDAQHGRIIRVNEKGEIVWSFRNIKRPVFSKKLKNGGCESIGSSGLPNSWTVSNLISHNSAVWEVDTEHSVKGKNCFKIVSVNDNHNLTDPGNDNHNTKKWYSQRLDIPADSKFKISGNIKTKNVIGGAAISITFYDPLGGIIGNVSSSQFRNTRDWEKIEFEAQTPLNCDHIEVCLGLVGAGEASFDDIIFKRKKY